MMGKKALEAAQLLVADQQLEGVLTPQQFLDQREEALDRLFPTSSLMPGTTSSVCHSLFCRVDDRAIMLQQAIRPA